MAKDLIYNYINELENECEICQHILIDHALSRELKLMVRKKHIILLEELIKQYGIAIRSINRQNLRKVI